LTSPAVCLYREVGRRGRSSRVLAAAAVALLPLVAAGGATATIDPDGHDVEAVSHNRD
jgi:hypothetical protein